MKNNNNLKLIGTTFYAFDKKSASKSIKNYSKVFKTSLVCLAWIYHILWDFTQNIPAGAK